MITYKDLFKKEEFKNIPKNFELDDIFKDRQNEYIDTEMSVYISKDCIINIYEKYCEETFNNMIIVTGHEEIVLFNKTTKEFKNFYIR